MSVCSLKLRGNGLYFSTGLGDCFGALFVSLMALQLTLVHQNPLSALYIYTVISTACSDQMQLTFTVLEMFMPREEYVLKTSRVQLLFCLKSCKIIIYCNSGSARHSCRDKVFILKKKRKQPCRLRI